jgi:hypothetical protein
VTTHRRLALTAVVGTVTAATLVGACGSSARTAVPVPAASPSPSVSASPLLPPSPYAGITAASLAAKILTTKDFPAGWTATAAQQSDDDSDEQALAACLKLVHEKFLDRSRTMVFTKGDVSVYAQVERKSGAAYDREVAAYASADKVRICTIATLQTELALTAGVSGGKVDGVTLKVPTGKDLGIAFTIVSSATQAEQRRTHSGAVGLFAAKPYEVQVVFVSAGAAPDAALRDHIFRTVAERLRAQTL